MVNPILEKLIIELEKPINGDPWFGSPLSVVLKNIDSDLAVKKPNNSIHSIAEIAYHMLAWMEEVLSRLEFNEAKEPSRGDWKNFSLLTEKEWNELINEIFSTHKKLIERVKIFPFEKLEDNVGGERNRELGSGITYREMLVGLMGHNIYHAGQIALIKKLFGK